jgi:hypothetical protein
MYPKEFSAQENGGSGLLPERLNGSALYAFRLAEWSIARLSSALQSEP